MHVPARRRNCRRAWLQGGDDQKVANFAQIIVANGRMTDIMRETFGDIIRERRVSGHVGGKYK
jgi:hypothetical protein